MNFKDYIKRQIKESKEEINLFESVRLERTDLEYFKNILKNPKNERYILKSYSEHYTPDEREVEIKALDGIKRIVISFNMDFEELTQEIVDICDDLGYTFQDNRERNINTISLEIYK